MARTKLRFGGKGRARWRAVRSVALCASALFLLATSSAQAAEWPITPIEPAPGASLPAAWSMTQTQMFQFHAPPTGPYGGFISVWSRNPAEPGNLFPDEARVDFFPVSRSPVDPTVYQGRSGGVWTSRPGTYYWRAASSFTEGPPTYRFAGLGSPVFSVNVVAIGGESPEQRSIRCAVLGGRVGYFTRRIWPVERAIDLAGSSRRRKQLQRTLRRLRLERRHVLREAESLCH
jgi:hypothetical protein